MRRQAISIGRIQQAAAKLGLRFDETEYRGKDTPHRFVCTAAGHVRMMSPGNVVYRQARCAQCLQPLRDSSIADARRMGEQAGGRCLSQEVPSAIAKLRWECRDQHQWETSLELVAAGHWCPECNKSGLSERQCRTALEQLFGVPFPKSHPDWLRIPGARRPLELDGYAASLGIAFEYHGGQHYRIVPRLAATQARLDEIQRRDRLRRELCQAHGVVLIEIAEFSTSDLQGRVAHIRNATASALHAAGRAIADDHFTKPCDLLSAFSSTVLQRMDETAAKQGGRCVSRTFQGWNSVVEWECRGQHRWMASPSSVVHGDSWCPACAGQVGPSLEALAAKAAARGWTLLSTEYINAKEKLRFLCAAGHETAISSDNFQRGKGCGTCKRLRAGATQRLSLSDVQAAAVQRGGQCVSTEYRNSQSKLRWRCARHHEWEAVWSSIRNGTWCPICSRIQAVGRPRRRSVTPAPSGDGPASGAL